MKCIYLFILLFILPFIFPSCSSTTPPTIPKKDSVLYRIKQPSIADESSAYKWSYNSEEDKLTSKMIYGATLMANDLLDLKFPYQGSQAAIRLIYRDNKNMAVLCVTKGQFMASSIDNQDIKIRFDSSKVEIYNCPGSSDGDTRYLLIRPSNKVIEKIKHSKKMIIEAEMYDNGLQQMEFNCEGLNWNH